MPIALSQDPAADALLDRDPLALLIGMVLDQQFPLERAFAAPYELTRRLGHELDVTELANYDPDRLAAIFTGPPALHRYPKSMAARVQAVCAILVGQYDGRVEQLWSGVADGAELLARIGALPGFGAQKAKIYLALLGKQRGVTPAGWREAASPYGPEGTYLSVADITDPQTLGRVREYKQELKAAAKAAARAEQEQAAGTDTAGTGTAGTGEAGMGKKPDRKAPATKTTAARSRTSAQGAARAARSRASAGTKAGR